MTALALAVIAWGAAAGPVELRGGMVERAPVEDVSIEGVRVGGERPRLIAWDHVKRFTGDDEIHNTAENLDRATRAWRARLRLARGDIQRAAPLFEALADQYNGRGGPTALMVAEGLVRCRFWEGDVPRAIEPWLEAVALREAGAEIAGDPPLHPTLDPETLLVPAMPPLLLRDVLPVEVREASAEDESSPIASSMRRSTLAITGMTIDEPSGETIDHPGARLLATMAAALRGGEESRRRARAALAVDLDDEDAPPWREAWARATIGLSLIGEPDPDRQADGVEHLLHLPARFSRAQPYLAGLALAACVEHLRDAGREPEADALERELADGYPRHPAIVWLADRAAERRRAPTTDPEPETP